MTDRLALTPLTVDDADGMVAVYADERMYTYTGGTPPTADELRQRYDRLVGGWNHDRSEQWCNWIVRVSGRSEPIGAMQATIADDLAWASVAWEIAVGHQGNRYASEAARAIVDWLMVAGVARITAAVHPDHRASANVARMAGLSPTSELDDGEVVWER
ncbi:MAG: GNAT family N-acetyltransferase [Actinomycetia bacterium]|nr:GNAT family N-acetyltransferase [Actinomycetes bacterium]